MAKQLIVNNLLVSYSDSAGLGDVSLVFLHGWRSQKEIWGKLIQAMPQAWSCYALDLPGFGASQAPLAALYVNDYVQAVAEFLKKLGLKNVVLVGHSFGGRIAIKLAASQPGLLSKLVLIDSAGFVNSKNQFFAIAAKIARPFFKPQFMQSLRGKIYSRIGAEDYVATPNLKQTFVNIINEDLSKYLPQINSPTLLVWGEKDPETPVIYGERMNREIPNSKLIVIPGAGHFSFLDNPSMVAGGMINFIKP